MLLTYRVKQGCSAAPVYCVCYNQMVINEESNIIGLFLPMALKKALTIVCCARITPSDAAKGFPRTMGYLMKDRDNLVSFLGIRSNSSLALWDFMKGFYIKHHASMPKCEYQSKYIVKAVVSCVIDRVDG